MSRHPASLETGYFDTLYAEDPDPWRFASSAYERDKYAATLRALPKPRYRMALEVGCSIGVFTAELAPRCASLVAIDAAARALDGAARRCTHLPQVELARMRVPEEWPDGRFDLILLSEVLYYLDQADVIRVAERTRSCLAPDGDVVLVHWTGETDYPQSADAAVAAFIHALRDSLRPVTASRRPCYRLDVLTAA